MLSSLRLKEVLRDKSRSYMRISYKKYNEMCTELLTQRVMLDADSAVLEVLEDAYSRQRVECVRASRRYVELKEDHLREYKRVNTYKADWLPVPPKLDNTSFCEGDDFHYCFDSARSCSAFEVTDHHRTFTSNCADAFQIVLPGERSDL